MANESLNTVEHDQVKFSARNSFHISQFFGEFLTLDSFG